MFRQRVIGAALWIADYTISVIVSGLLLHTLFWAIEFFGYYSEGVLIFSGPPSTPIYFFPLMIFVMAAPTAGLLLGLPELFGIKPNVKIWFVLGGVVAATSLFAWINFFFSADWSLKAVIRMAVDPGIMALIFSGMIAGGLLGFLRRP